MNNENTNQGFEFNPKQSEDKPNEETIPQQGHESQSSGYQGHQATSSTGSPKPVMQQPLPNSGGILAMGIISIVMFCCCYGGISLILGIIALVLSSKANRLYMKNPELYTESSYKNMKAGRVTAIIGLSLAALMMIIGIIALASGLNILSTQEALQEFERAWESTGY
ncbi:MAG: CCC motif membrane protein [Bacteroidales bacterium]